MMKAVKIALISFNTFPNMPWFLRICRSSLLKTLWKKEELLVTNNVSFFHSLFYPFGEVTAIFIKFKIVVCKLFQFGPVGLSVLVNLTFSFYSSTNSVTRLLFRHSYIYTFAGTKVKVIYQGKGKASRSHF